MQCLLSWNLEQSLHKNLQILYLVKNDNPDFKKNTTIYSSTFYDIWHHLLQFPKCLKDKTVKEYSNGGPNIIFFFSGVWYFTRDSARRVTLLKIDGWDRLPTALWLFMVTTTVICWPTPRFKLLKWKVLQNVQIFTYSYFLKHLTVNTSTCTKTKTMIEQQKLQQDTSFRSHFRIYLTFHYKVFNPL